MRNKKNKIGHLITYVQPGFIAEELAIEAGAYLLEINGQTIDDVFDYRFEMQEELVNILMRHQVCIARVQLQELVYILKLTLHVPDFLID